MIWVTHNEFRCTDCEAVEYVSPDERDIGPLIEKFMAKHKDCDSKNGTGKR